MSGVEHRVMELMLPRGSGRAVEVAYRDFRGDTVTTRGRLRGFSTAARQITVEVGGQVKRIAEEKVRYVSPVDEILHAASFHEGDRVRITKYGGQYVGKVEDVFTTRLDVVFTTLGGKVKRQRIPAIDCERVS
jgi:phage-related minor tail protein